MSDKDWLAERFQESRARLQAVAYRILGSRGEAEDAVQEAWLRLSRSDAAAIENLGGWLTTVVARVCLDMLRSRKSRKEEALESHLEGPLLASGAGPEEEVLLADSLGSALLIVLHTLSPAERVAFVLHDLFDLSFAEIAPILGRSEAATRQLASRARRGVQGNRENPEEGARKREVVRAFLAASREGDFEALLKLLDPEIELFADEAAVRTAAANKDKGAPQFQAEMRGGKSIAELFKGRALAAQAALINGAVGTTWIAGGKPRVAFLFTFHQARISQIEVVMDPEDLGQMDIEPMEG